MSITLDSGYSGYSAICGYTDEDVHTVAPELAGLDSGEMRA